jgi:hypothetical protein
MALFCIAPDTSMAADAMNNTESSFVCIIVVSKQLDFIIKLQFFMLPAFGPSPKMGVLVRMLKYTSTVNSTAILEHELLSPIVEF